MIRRCLPCILVLSVVGCASGNEGVVADTDPIIDQLPRDDAYIWPDLGPAPDAFIWPDGMGDVSIYHDADPTPPDSAVPDATPAPDSQPPCPDPYEPNEICAASKSLGTTKEGSSWLSKTGTSNPPVDVDWYTAKGEEGSGLCFPGTSECFYLKVRLDVPVGRHLKVCVMQDSCSAGATCAKNASVPGPQQLNVQYKVNGTCALNDDTYPKIWVEQLDAAGGCDSYTIAVNFDEC